MKQLEHFYPLLGDLKQHLTRKNAERFFFVFVLFCASSLLWFRIPTQGALTFDNGTITYSGYIVANKMSGQGKLTFQNGDVYEGNFKNGIFDGQGTFTSSSGWTYVGEFENGLANGQGTLTTADKTVYQGTFKQGIYQHEN